MPLQWSDDDVFVKSNVDPVGEQPELALGPEQIETPLEYSSSLEMLIAELRSRFYFARFVLYRPFIFKSLHLSHLLDAHDAQ